MIWSYPTISKLVEKKFQITHSEGNTPVDEVLLKPKASEPILIKLKREDTNPAGSFKDRSLAYQISYYWQKGVKELVISSSGNAAISAVSYCNDADIKLHVFISEDISQSKMKRIEAVMSPNIKIHKSKKAKSDAIKYAKENNIINLRGSMDEMAVVGFKTLGYEIAEIVDLVDSVFIPCSSGTSTIGIYQGLKEMQKEKGISMPRIHIVQTTKIHPIASMYDKEFKIENSHPADSIVDRVANRKNEVMKAIDETLGFGWVISKEELKEAQMLLKDNDVLVSNTAALSIAGIIKASRKGRLTDSPLAIISGL